LSVGHLEKSQEEDKGTNREVEGEPGNAMLHKPREGKVIQEDT
jgi:hypothetical protein